MQDWTTVSGNVPGTATVIQGENEWQDLAPYRDCAFWVECRQATFTTSLTLFVDTAPAADEALFVAIGSIAPHGQQTPVVINGILAYPSIVPLARWVRWRLTATGTGAWSVTFRIWATFATPGA
jgi:hypothetical protein